MPTDVANLMSLVGRVIATTLNASFSISYGSWSIIWVGVGAILIPILTFIWLQAIGGIVSNEAHRAWLRFVVNPETPESIELPKTDYDRLVDNLDLATATIRQLLARIDELETERSIIPKRVTRANGRSSPPPRGRPRARPASRGPRGLNPKKPPTQPALTAPPPD